jgi:iron(III) transport system substrate-binding protein
MQRRGGVDGTDDGPSLGRRDFLAATGTAGVGALAGCSLLGGPGAPRGDLSIDDFRGSGQLIEGRGAPGGTSITDLPDLEGELTFYLSFGEGGLYLDLIDLFADYYPDFEYQHTQESSSGLANRIVEEVEAGASQADVFVAVDAGSLARVAEAGATRTLPDTVLDAVPASLRTDQWVGIAGRARAVPYDADALTAEDVPDTVREFPDTPAFEDSFGWAPTYSAFQSLSMEKSMAMCEWS